MTSSDWITIAATMISGAFVTGVVLAKTSARFRTIESDIKEIKKDIRKISRIVIKHHNRIKRLEKKCF